MNNTSGVGDIQIGSVEIKDGTTDTRATVHTVYGLSSDIKRDTSFVIRSGSLQGRITLSSTPVALKAGVSELSGRHTLQIINDSSTNIYLGFNSNVSSDDGFQLPSGSGVSFHFDPAESFSVYGVLIENTTDVTIFELK